MRDPDKMTNEELVGILSGYKESVSPDEWKILADNLIARMHKYVEDGVIDKDETGDGLLYLPFS